MKQQRRIIDRPIEFGILHGQIDLDVDLKRIPQLDGIRGIAILQVLIWHYQGAVQVEFKTPLAYFLRLFSLTWSGVDLFFVLSGFLIGGILIDNKGSPNYFQVFYIRRICRIFPLYFLLIAIGQALNVAGQLSASQTGELIAWPWYVFFIQNVWMSLQSWPSAWRLWLGQTWSLAVEEQFYLLLPFAIWLVPKRQLSLLLIPLVLAVIPLRCVIYTLLRDSDGAVANHVLLPCRMDSLLLGVLVAVATREPKIKQWLSNGNEKYLYLPFAACLLAGASIIILGGLGLGSQFMETIGLSVLALLYTCFLLISLTEKRGPVRWMTNLAPLRQMGVWAFSIYLIHTEIP